MFFFLSLSLSIVLLFSDRMIYRKGQIETLRKRQRQTEVEIERETDEMLSERNREIDIERGESWL